MSKPRTVDFNSVKASVSILQILKHYNLEEHFKRNGDSLSGKCPLHDGDNPTQFRVSLSKNCWNCFGQCKRGGNILDFVSIREHVSIREAAIKIAEWFGISTEVPKRQSKEQPKAPTPHSKHEEEQPSADNPEDRSAPNKPLGFKLQNLASSHPYLDKREINASTIREFGLGHCAKGSMAGRIVIPIHNQAGELLAYAGRWPGTPPDDTPKYKLPAGFKKSMELFNLHRAIKESPEQRLILVEGFFDCMKLHQNGYRKVVALMGSSMSEAQEELLRKHVPPRSSLIIMLDEDEAGRAGRETIAHRLAKAFFVRIYVFGKEGAQPEALSPEEIRAVTGGAF